MSTVKKCLKCVGVGHPLCHSIDIQEKMIKTEGEEGKRQQRMYGEIIIQDPRVKAAVACAMVGSVKSG